MKNSLDKCIWFDKYQLKTAVNLNVMFVPSGTDNKPLTRLLHEGSFQELWEVLLGLHLHHTGPDNISLDLKESFKVFQPLHFVIQIPLRFC